MNLFMGDKNEVYKNRLNGFGVGGFRSIPTIKIVGCFVGCILACIGIIGLHPVREVS